MEVKLKFNQETVDKIVDSIAGEVAFSRNNLKSEEILTIIKRSIYESIDALSAYIIEQSKS